MRIALVCLLLALATPACRQFTGADPKETETALGKAADCPMTWGEIFTEYQKNAVRFEKEVFPRIKGTKVSWTGVVEDISPKFATVDLDGTGGADIELYMAEDQITKLNEKEKVTFDAVITDWTKLRIDGFMLMVDGKVK